MLEATTFPESPHDSILRWLQGIAVASGTTDEKVPPPASTATKPETRKRPNTNPHPPPPPKRRAMSPPSTDSHDSQQRTRAGPEQRAAGAMAGEHQQTTEVVDDDETEATPRPLQRYTRQMGPPLPPAAPSPSRTQSSTRSSSKRSASSSISRNSSPSKQLRLAELYDQGYRRSQFTLEKDTLPVSLRAVLRRLRDISNGQTKLPYCWWEDNQEQLEALDVPSSFFRNPQDNSPEVLFARRPDRPLPAFIKLVVEIAARCNVRGEMESQWSWDVYNRIISWVLRPVDEQPAGLVDLRLVTHSKIIPEYQPPALPSKMVDCCLVFVTESESSIERRIAELSRTRPGKSINHSSSGTLCRYPIGLSLEVKSPRGDPLEAEVQMGTWHAAQWRSLRPQHSVPQHTGAATPAIDFLPGIIIAGHEWYFVATLPPQQQSHGPPDVSAGSLGKPTFYSRFPIGSTHDETGVCKIIASLQCLVSWLEKEYWPAFQAEILGLGGSPASLA